MRSFIRAFLAATLLFSWPAVAQSEKSTRVASNGTEVTIYSDSFADRYEYSAPAIDLPDLGGYALVAKIVKGGVAGPLEIVGSIMYRGDWRYYSSAILRGGESVVATFDNRKVVSCSGSRYGGCSLREGFRVLPTAAQIAKFGQNGAFDIQIRAQAGPAVIISVPLTYIAAVNEIAKR